MGCYYMKMMFVFTTILLLGLHKILAARTLEGDQQWLQQKNLLIQSLQRGPVKSSKKNPCSTVPGRSRGHCTLSEMNVAGHVAHAALKFGAPSINAYVTPKKGLEILTGLEKHLNFQQLLQHQSVS